jgi:ornithine carbamoyltransferase
MTKDLLSITDFSQNEIVALFDLARKLKRYGIDKIPFQPLAGKTLGMIFTKSSTRTRVSFEVGIYQLGGHALFLNSQDLQLGRGESIPDTARILSRYLDLIMIRTFEHRDVEELARFAAIPVINGLTDLLHPCQVLSDLFTILEKRKTLEGLKIAFLGDGNNVAHSWLNAAQRIEMDLRIIVPHGYEPNEQILRDTLETGTSTVTVTDNVEEGVRDANVLYTDVWCSMGQEAEREEKISIMSPYQLNARVTGMAQKNALVMHCLPAHRGEEITDDVIDGPQSIVFTQAENRLHVQKAIMIALSGEGAFLD